jgi:hypothetical protein
MLCLGREIGRFHVKLNLRPRCRSLFSSSRCWKTCLENRESSTTRMILEKTSPKSTMPPKHGTKMSKDHAEFLIDSHSVPSIVCPCLLLLSVCLSKVAEVISLRCSGLKGKLIDNEGFPRADVDVHQVRIHRNRIACELSFPIPPNAASPLSAAGNISKPPRSPSLSAHL